MEKEDQDFSKVESKFKLSLLQVERRFVDLETVVSEVSEKLKDVDLTGVSEVKQRTDDIEDLIMVEQAAIIELKKMLEGIQIPTVDISGLETRITELEKVGIKPLTEQINALKQETDGKINEFSSKLPNLVTDVISSKYDILQQGLSDLLNKKVGMDLKVEGLRKDIQLVEHKIGEMATEKIAEEIQNNKKDIILIGAKIETIENITKNMNSDLQQAQANLLKLDSFEKLTLLRRDIESKIERFKIIEDELRRLSSRMEMLYSNMDERIEGATQTGKKLPGIFDSINNFKKELDKQRIEILDRVKKEDIKDLTKVFEQNAAKVSAEVENKYKELTKSLEQNVQTVSVELENEYNDLLKRVSKVNAVDKKELETARNNLTVRIDNLRVDLQKINDRLSKEVTGVAADTQNSYNSVNSLYKEIKNKVDIVQTKDFVRKNDLQYLYKSVKDLDGKLNEVNNKVRKVNVDDVLKVMEVFKKDVDDRLDSLQQKEDSLVDEAVRHTELGFDEMDYRIQTLLDKIVYLETRMAAMEKMLEDTRMPVIIE